MPARVWTRRLEEARLATAFLTRLPLPVGSFDAAALARAVWAFPLAGLLVGALAAALYAAALWLGLTPWLAATLAVLAQVLATGGLHEDGLADSADGLGGHDRLRRLEIMRDSATGSYGVMALVLSLGLRIGALTALAGPEAVAAALLAAAMLSRAAIGLSMRLLRPARADGLSAAAGRPEWVIVVLAWCLAAALSLPGLGGAAVLALLAGAAVSALAITVAAWRRLGGQTGDTLGAVQQVSESVCLLLLCAAPWA